MNAITMLELRRDSASVLGRLAKGERLILSHRGKPVARLEPVAGKDAALPSEDPFLDIASRAVPAPRGPTTHRHIDTILYGKT